MTPSCSPRPLSGRRWWRPSHGRPGGRCSNAGARGRSSGSRPPCCIARPGAEPHATATPPDQGVGVGWGVGQGRGARWTGMGWPGALGPSLAGGAALDHLAPRAPSQGGRRLLELVGAGLEQTPRGPGGVVGSGPPAPDPGAGAAGRSATSGRRGARLEPWPRGCGGRRLRPGVVAASRPAQPHHRQRRRSGSEHERSRRLQRRPRPRGRRRRTRRSRARAMLAQPGPVPQPASQGKLAPETEVAPGRLDVQRRVAVRVGRSFWGLSPGGQVDQAWWRSAKMRSRAHQAMIDLEATAASRWS